MHQTLLVVLAGDKAFLPGLGGGYARKCGAAWEMAFPEMIRRGVTLGLELARFDVAMG